ncbi:hypothetical protein ES702_05277 [subsurface metagenome]
MKCINLSEAATRLSVSDSTIRRYVRDGKLSGIKLERGYRILESDFEKFIQERKVPEGGNR